MSAETVLTNPLALKLSLEGSAAPAVLDVRWKLGDTAGRQHHHEEHIPGAVYVDLDSELAAHGQPTDGRHPLPSIDALQAAARAWGISEGQAVVVYDDNGAMSAARAWWLLRWAGIDDVKILDGSLAAWKAAGLPVESGNVDVPVGDVTLSAGHLPTLTADQAGSLTADGVLLDARAAERYRGETEPVDPRAGHIPGALSAPTSENLDAGGKFLDEDALRARFDSLGAGSGTQVGVYCGSGVTAAHLAAALQIVGVSSALFPGSWSAWSSDPDRPAAVGSTP